jgi:ATP-dependent helicase/DNAse subunit B
MPADKFSAVWISHTSISDFLSCPRAYFLKNVYKDPKTGHKIKLMSPPLALGQAVHEVIESLSVISVDRRFTKPLIDLYETAWKKITGKNGGFYDSDTEFKYRSRGQEMITRAQKVKGPLALPAVKISQDLPQFWLSEKDNIILCGKIDWLEYLPDTDSVHIIDFKTSRGEEDPESLQLPIYHLLVHHCQHRTVTKASYWYLDRSDVLEEKPLPDLVESEEKLLAIGRKIKLARQLKHFVCPHQGCRSCLPYEDILNNQADFVGVDGYKYDVYTKPFKPSTEKDSIIL